MKPKTYYSKLFAVKLQGVFLPPFACPTSDDARAFFIDLCASLTKSCSLWYVGDFNGKTGFIYPCNHPVKLATHKKGKNT